MSDECEFSRKLILHSSLITHHSALPLPPPPSSLRDLRASMVNLLQTSACNSDAGMVY